MDSPFSRFNETSYRSSRAVIGGEEFTIGDGPTLLCVLNETSDQRSYEDSGFDRTTTLDAVFSYKEFNAAYPAVLTSYIGQVASVRGQSLRIVQTDEEAKGITKLTLQDTRRA